MNRDPGGHRRHRWLRGALPLRPVDPSRSDPRQQHRQRRHEAEGRAGARTSRHDRDRPRERVRQRHRRLRRGPPLFPRLPRPWASCAPRWRRRSLAAWPRACAAAGIPLIGGETAQMPDLYRERRLRPRGLHRRRRRPRRHHRRLSVRAATFCSVCRRPGCTRMATRWRVGSCQRRRGASRCRTTGRRSARRSWSRIGPTSTRSGSCAGNCERPAPISQPSRISPVADGGEPAAYAAGGPGRGDRDGLIADPAIFSLIQSSGDIADDEMVRTFNVGIGLTAIVPAAHADAALAAVGDAYRVGA